MVNEHIGKLSGRKEDSHKGDYGRVLVVAGSTGLTGAAFLASQGALVAGAGLVTCAVPESLNQIMEIKLTEVMTLPLAETREGGLSLKSKEKIVEFAGRSDVVAIGPGLGKANETYELVKSLLGSIDETIVLDADGINALEGDLDILVNRSAGTVITPHPGEMARLVEKDVEEVQADRIETAKSVAEITGAVVCLKGHKTVVAAPDGKVYINETGNSGMATGGVGDCLTGMIASFIGQGVDEFSATVSAVYIHGMAGDIAAEKKGAFSMIATDILEYLPEAFGKSGV